MSRSPIPSLLRIGTIVMGLAVIASGINLIRAERAADRVDAAAVNSPAPPPIQTDLSGLSPAAKQDAIKTQIAMLQRELDDSRRRQAESARARTERGDAQAFLQISVALLVVFLMATTVLRLRAAKAEAVESGDP